jgi:hypothetical protein
MTIESGRLRAVLVLLLFVSAALFAVGTTIERRRHSGGEQPVVESTAPAEGSSESGRDVHPSETPSASGELKEKASEKLFGFDPEASWVVAVGVAVSVLLGLAVWFLRRAGVLVAAGVFGLMVAVLDVRETIHQINASRASLVVVSAVLALMHLAIGGIAAMLLRGRSAQEVAA